MDCRPYVFQISLRPLARQGGMTICPTVQIAVQGGSYALYTSSAVVPVGMDLVSTCRRTCLQAQAAAPSQAPAPPPPAILI